MRDMATFAKWKMDRLVLRRYPPAWSTLSARFDGEPQFKNVACFRGAVSDFLKSEIRALNLTEI